MISMTAQRERQPGQARLTRHGLFTDIRGDAASPPLLFLHGGPGQGSYDFMALQGDRLAANLQVIGLDQRGVDRSAPLAADTALTIADVVDDCEELRRALGIERWAVLGHSFGGLFALRYAITYAGAVSAVVFENPAVDIALACRAGLTRAVTVLTGLGKTQDARAAQAALDADAASKPTVLAGTAGEGGAGSGTGLDERAAARALRQAYWTALDALDGERESFFTPDPATRARLARIHADRPEVGTAEDRKASEASTHRFHLAIVDDDAGYDPGLPLLPRLAAPALLITGGQDPVTDDGLRAAFRAASPANRLAGFPGAGHFAHADAPAPYAAAVTGFLAGQP
jgi:proline iminopeptidase